MSRKMDFSEKFTTYSNTELLQLIKNPDDYQPQAVEAAKSIFSGRQLNSHEMEAAELLLLQEAKKQEINNQQRQKTANKIRNITASIFNNINPFQSKAPTTGRIIRNISIFLGALFLWRLYKEFNLLRCIFTDPTAGFDFSMGAYFFSFLVIPLTVIFFFRRKKIGWILLSIYSTTQIISAIATFIQAMPINYSPNSLFGNLFPFIAPAHLLIAVFWSGILWTICQRNISAIYGISKRFMKLSIVITAILVALMFILLW
jgi:hypothetical protein